MIADGDAALLLRIEHGHIKDVQLILTNAARILIALFGNLVAMAKSPYDIWTVAMLPPRLAARALVRLYRMTLSPLVGFHCRHLPTCSEYADQALARHGLWAGGWMTLARICRCQPLGTSGLDFVPENLPAAARWYLPWRYARWRGTNEHPPKST